MSKDFWLVLAGIILAALYSCGVAFLGYEQGHKGEVTLQARWDAQNKLNASVAAAAKAKNASTTSYLQNQFGGINSTYLGITNAPTPSIFSTIPASMSAGTVQLRDTASCPSSSRGSTATAASRAADAAATQALADRVSNSIAAVRAGDEADKRERDLDAQIIALQNAITAERKAMDSIGTVPNGGH